LQPRRTVVEKGRQILDEVGDHCRIRW
jgi:hypothetical protein